MSAKSTTRLPRVGTRTTRSSILGFERLSERNFGSVGVLTMLAQTVLRGLSAGGAAGESEDADADYRAARAGLEAGGGDETGGSSGFGNSPCIEGECRAILLHCFR